jgi:lysophospholipase L1-like esterase
MKITQLVLSATLLALTLGSMHAQTTASAPNPSSAAAAKAAAAVKAVDDKVMPDKSKRIVLAGDSMMNHSSGWGSGFCDALAGEIECFNMSKNGRSSKSFRNEGWWDRALALKPTWILISFGGNDVPGKGPERETDPATTYYAIMKQYVLDARAAGATPIIVTSLPGRIYKDGKFLDPYVPYAQAARKVAKDTNALLMDLNADATAFLVTLTQQQADAYDRPTGVPGGELDRHHLNPAGSTLFGTMAAREFVAAVPALSKKVFLPAPAAK